MADSAFVLWSASLSRYKQTQAKKQEAQLKQSIPVKEASTALTIQLYEKR